MKLMLLLVPYAIILVKHVVERQSIVIPVKARTSELYLPQTTLALASMVTFLLKLLNYKINNNSLKDILTMEQIQYV
jgi:hypothetical protein